VTLSAGCFATAHRRFVFAKFHERIPGRQSDAKGLAMTSEDSKVKIRRWQKYIEECRQEAKLLSPEGQREMQKVIASYEKLIAMAQGEALKRKD
jgi:hypothetical protein